MCAGSPLGGRSRCAFVETYPRIDSHLVPLPVMVVIVMVDVIVVDESVPVGVMPADDSAAPALTGAMCVRAGRKVEDIA